MNSAEVIESVKPRGQTRIGSFIESITNVLIGYVIAILTQLFVFPLYGIKIHIGTNLKIGFWFTIISIIRSYAIRRWFNFRRK